MIWNILKQWFYCDRFHKADIAWEADPVLIGAGLLILGVVVYLVMLYMAAN